MNWLSLILGVLKAVNVIVNMLHERQLISAGGAAAIANVLQGQANDLKKKVAEMAAAGADFDAGRGLPEYRDDDAGPGSGKPS
jgi:hypothetical protein